MNHKLAKIIKKKYELMCFKQILNSELQSFPEILVSCKLKSSEILLKLSLVLFRTLSAFYKIVF